ncbi:MAG: hypothetical protein GY930_21360 [bacterium]|nr:hypothetical protein [bacterium]
MEKSFKGTIACCLALCLAVGASAQSDISRSDLSKASQNDKSLLIPYDALMIRGIAHDSNDFLANTPALRSGRTIAQLVATEDARERRLAMYEDGKRFDSAPRRDIRMSASDPGIPVAADAPSDPGSRPPGEEQDDDSPTRLLWPAAFIGLVICALKKLTS